MAEQKIMVARGADRLAVIDADKRGIGAQALRDLFRKAGAGGCIGALNAPAAIAVRAWGCAAKMRTNQW
jgi:hypothetical protein